MRYGQQQKSNKPKFLYNVLFGLMVICSFQEKLASASSHAVPPKDHSKNRYFAVESSLSPEELTNMYSDWSFEHAVRGLDNHYVFSINSTERSLHKREQKVQLDSNTTFFEELPLKKLHKRRPVPREQTEEQAAAVKLFQDTIQKYEIKDPLFNRQWHLINTYSPGNDVNAVPVWDKGITGAGVTVAIVDDGLDYENPDLADNFSPEGSWDYNDNTNLPKPRLADDYHGTRCAGEIAAVRNEYCGMGVAYNAKVAGIRILSGELTAEDEAASLIYAYQTNDIYSCSWGPPDNGIDMDGPSDLVKKALTKGIQEGRNNKGSVYVFASGNGAMYGDNCNFDGYTNSIYSITVGAIDYKGLHSPYSESCSAVLTVTYSSGSGEYIHSTDINNQCSDKHGGTSAAAPLAAGIYALVLEANPNLTWRDVQYLTIVSGVEVNVDNEKSDWQPAHNKFGKRYSHMYGFGKLDANAIVELAQSWENVNEQVMHEFPKIEVNEVAQNMDDTIESVLEVTEEDMNEFNMKHLEHVTVTVNADSKVRGLNYLELVSPNGTVSKLAVERKIDKNKGGYDNWTFMSVANWGEQGVGQWKLRAKITRDVNELTLKDWTLKIYGEARDEHSDEGTEDDATPTTIPDTETSTYSEITSTTSTTSIEEPTSTIAETSSVTATSSPSSATDAPPKPSKTGTSEDSYKSHLIDTAEKHYFIFLIIFGFVLIVGYYILFRNSRRKFQRLRAEAYEFDIIDSDSEYDASVNMSQQSIPTESGEPDLEDYDFDLSEEEDITGQERRLDEHGAAPESSKDKNDGTGKQESAPESSENKSGVAKELENPFESPDDPDTKK
ncbi:hypothetical protein ACO0QE_000935 [Hanseniaspora vineae]